MSKQMMSIKNFIICNIMKRTDLEAVSVIPPEDEGGGEDTSTYGQEWPI